MDDTQRGVHRGVQRGVQPAHDVEAHLMTSDPAQEPLAAPDDADPEPVEAAAAADEDRPGDPNGVPTRHEPDIPR